MKISTTVYMILLLIACFTVNAQPDTKLNNDSIKNKWKDISYAAVSAAQKLDIYLPNTGDGPFPVILAIHGGGFKFGDKASAAIIPMLEGLKRGYAVVSINYRLSGEAKAPQLI